MEQLLEVRNLKTHFHVDEGTLKAVDGVSFSVAPSRTLGLIGESGCGKSVTAQSILQIVPSPGQIIGGQILLHLNGEPVDIAQLSATGEMIRRIRGKEIGMVFQEPMTSLSPVYTVGDQICESLLLHVTDDRREAQETAVDLLNKVGINNPAQRVNEYPHQLSGGMRQRVMIAIALSCGPKVLIAD